MSTFGSSIKIIREHKSKIKLCAQKVVVTQGLVYSFSLTDDIKLFDYKSYTGEDDPEAVFNLQDDSYHPVFISVSSGKEFFIVAQNESNNENYGFRLDKDYNIVTKSSSFGNLSLQRGFHKVRINETTEEIYVYDYTNVFKCDYDFNIKWHSTPTGNITGLCITPNNRVFLTTFEMLYEINPNNGNIIDSFDPLKETSPSGNYSLYRIIGLSYLSTGELIIMQGATNNNGALKIFSISNGITRSDLLWSEEEGFSIGNFSSVNILSSYQDGYVYFCDTDSQRLFQYDTINKTLLFDIAIRDMNPSSTWTTGRPNSMMVDLEGNCVVGIGLGSDSRAIGVVDYQGNPIFGKSINNEGVSIHYEGWQQFAFK